MENKKMGVSYSVLAIVLFLVVCFFAVYIVGDRKFNKDKNDGSINNDVSGNTNNENDNNNSSSESNGLYVEDDYISFVYSCGNEDTSVYDNICGIDSKGNMIELVSGANTRYDAYDISNGYLYYVDKQNFLHSLSLDEKREDTNFNFKIDKNFFDIAVDGDNVFVLYSVENEIVNVKSLEVQKLPFVANNLTYFKDNKIYFTDRDNKNLYSYDVITKEQLLISTNSRIIFKDKKSFAYIKDDHELYLYDVEANSSNFIKYFESTIDSSYNIIFSNDILYYIFENSRVLYRYQDNELKELVQINDKGMINFSIFSLFKINDSLLLIRSLDFEGEGSESGPSGGTVKNYLYDINTGSLNETSIQVPLNVVDFKVVYSK